MSKNKDYLSYVDYSTQNLVALASKASPTPLKLGSLGNTHLRPSKSLTPGQTYAT